MRSFLFVFALAVLPVKITSADETLPFLTVDPKGFMSSSIRDLALSENGRWLAAAGGKEVRVWDLEKGIEEPVAVLRGFQLGSGLILGRANAVCFSNEDNPKYLAVGVSDNTKAGSTRVYTMDDLPNFELLEGHTACTDRVAFSHDGQYLVTYG